MRKALPSSPNDLVTFQYDQSCVFVKPSENYQDAIDIAQKEFYELANISRDRIGFAVIDNNNERRQIRISESAWSAVIGKLHQGSIVHVIVRPDPDAKAPPPQYLEIPAASTSSEGHSYLRHTRSDMSIKRISSNTSGRSTKSSHGIFSWIGSGK